MRTRLKVQVDRRAISMAASIRTAARSAPLFVLTGRALGDLAAELGGFDQAAAELLAMAAETGRPIGINVALDAERSRTVFIPPKGWGEQRLAGLGAVRACRAGRADQPHRRAERLERGSRGIRRYFVAGIKIARSLGPLAVEHSRVRRSGRPVAALARRL
jgi:hypothetical protein